MNRGTRILICTGLMLVIAPCLLLPRRAQSFTTLQAQSCTALDRTFGQPGAAERVKALAVFDDRTEAGPALYVGGLFLQIGGIAANRIAKWDGRTWSTLDVGMSGPVYTLTVFDDGTGPALYAGGNFTNAGRVSANNIAKWNGSIWSPLGTGPANGTNNTVLALTGARIGGVSALYVGGSFSIAGGTLVNAVAQWDGRTWSALRGGTNGNVSALASFNDELYIGGMFTGVDGSSAANIARWNGSAWSALRSGVNSYVYALAVFNAALYAGGFFTSADGRPYTRGIARWNGADWSSVNTGISGDVFALTVFNDGREDALYAAGEFGMAGGVRADRIARWNGADWSALREGMGTNASIDVALGVNARFAVGPALYIGGSFSRVETFVQNYIARWLHLSPQITTQPVGQTACPGDTVTFQVTAQGTPPLNYQWYKDGAPITGAIQSQYVISPVRVADVGDYSVVVRDSCGSVTSNRATLSLRIPMITAQPGSQAVCVGGSVTFTVATSGPPPLAYQWRKNGVNIPGATAASYRINNAQPADAGTYDVVLTTACSPIVVVSNPATLSVRTAPVISQPPTNQIACVGSAATFSVTAQGIGSLSYQWRKNGVNIPGAIAASYRINNAQPADAGSYDVIVTDSCGSVTSSAATLTVTSDPPVITQQPVARLFCQGGGVTFTVMAQGGQPLRYQWRKNGVNISGAMAASYSIPNPQPSDEGSYDVLITDACNRTSTSNPATLRQGLRVDGFAPSSPRSGPTTGGGVISFAGEALRSGMSVTFQRGGYRVVVPQAQVMASADRTRLDVTLPSFPPGCDCTLGTPQATNVVFNNSCGTVDLFSTGNRFHYNPVQTSVSDINGVQAAIDGAAPGVCLVLRADPQVTYRGPLRIGPAKARMTLTSSDPSDAGRTQIRGLYDGGPPPVEATLTIDGAGEGVCVSYVNIIRGNSGIEARNRTTPWIKGCKIDDNVADADHGGGVTISSGAYPILVTSQIFANQTVGSGGGLRVESASASVVRNEIYANTTARSGGGVSINTAADGSVLLSDNQILLNPPPAESSVIPTQGGGVYWIGSALDRGRARVLRNDIKSNRALGEGAGFFLDRLVAPLIANNRILENIGTTKDARGGGVYIQAFNETVFPFLENVLFGNRAQIGGALYLNRKNKVEVERNLVFCNQAVQNDPQGDPPPPFYAAGVYVFDASPKAVHNTIYNNLGTSPDRTPEESGGLHGVTLGTGPLELRDLLAMNNEDYEIYSDVPLFSNPVRYSLGYQDPAFGDPSRIFHENTRCDTTCIVGVDPLFQSPPDPANCTLPADPWTAFALQPNSPAAGQASDGCPSACLGLDIGAVPYDGFTPGQWMAPSEGDCNANGVPDYIDILSGLSLDLDDDGIPDECQTAGSEERRLDNQDRAHASPRSLGQH